MQNYSQNKGLKNPAVAVAGYEVAKQTATVIPFIIKTAIIGGIAYLAYTSFVKRFKKIGENKNFPPANISIGEAQTRANSIYAAMYGFGSDIKTVQQNLAGLNYNGWVRLYNAFGNRAGINPLGDKNDLVYWLNDQFDEEQLQELRFVLPGLFMPYNTIITNVLTNFLTGTK